MRQELKILENIDRYIAGQMSVDELTAFESQINQNETLKQQVENQKMIIQATKREALSAQINAVAKGGFFNFKWALGIGLIVLIVGGLILTQLNLTPTQKVEKNTETSETKIQTENNEPIQTETLVQTDSIDNNDLIVKTKTKTQAKTNPNSKSIKGTKSQQTFGQNQNKNDEFYNFNGLQCWVKPDVQLFKIDANKTETIEGREGTLIIIPEHSFLDENGNEVSGKVNFELVEAYTLDDILLYNLTTTSNGNLLETGGMFYTNATQNGKTLTVNPNKPMMIQVPCTDEKPNMMAFESEIDTNGNINWKNPKPLEHFLTKVDMNLLDFLPIGFENEVYANMPIMGFEKANDKVVDSLYQLMRYETAIVLNEGYRYRLDYNKLYVEKSLNNCGVNPTSIKIIKENPDYANSFIATKEFEARLEKLHQLENGQEMLEIYLENLDKNLYYSDSLIYNCLQFDEDEESISFLTFYNQKKTKVKEGGLYAKALTEYYNHAKKDFNDEVEAIRQKGSTSINNTFKKLARLRKKSNILRNNIAKSNVSRGNNYTIKWASFGWANIDQYLHLLSKGSQDVEISCEQTKPKGRLRIYQWLGAISVLTPIIVNKLKGIVKVPKEGSRGSSKMSDTYALAVSKENGNWFFGLKKYNPYKNSNVDISLTEISLKDLKIKLNSIEGASPLVGRLENVKTKFYRDIRTKKITTGKFLNRLKKLCFPCYSGEGFSNSLENISRIYVFKHAYFKGGQVAIQKYVNQTYKHSFLQKIEGHNYKFLINAKVDRNGGFQNPKIYSTAPVFIKWKMKRVLKNMPNWIPAEQNSYFIHEYVTFFVDMPISNK